MAGELLSSCLQASVSVYISMSYVSTSHTFVRAIFRQLLAIDTRFLHVHSLWPEGVHVHSQWPEHVHFRIILYI